MTTTIHHTCATFLKLISPHKCKNLSVIRSYNSDNDVICSYDDGNDVIRSHVGANDNYTALYAASKARGISGLIIHILIMSCT